ncbi:MAG: T9SS type A sorting domain-containing protein [Bacteroidia bacterium]
MKNALGSLLHQIKLPVIAAGIIITVFSCNQPAVKYSSAGEAMEENPSARRKWERQMLADPATGEIPENIRARELAFSATLPVQQSHHKKDGEADWRSRGPWNLGGRTRAIAIDATNENILFAAGVSGGIWRSVNGGQSWNRVTKPNQLANITCIVQDTRKDKTHTWYAGTGELIGNSASGNSAFYLGDGILKSTDGGLNWQSLASTVSGKPQTLSKNFNLVSNIVINTAMDTGDVLFASTYGSVYRSDNGGEKWTEVRGSIGLNTPSVYTSVAMTSKGEVYATLSSDGTHKGIWRSTDGKTWTNITPAGFAAKYNRIEIGIDPSNENNVYFLGYTPNYGKRSVDFRGKEDWASFWIYTYISGDGNASGGKWEDRSQNLPDFGGYFGNFNTQTGYNMYVRVKPGSPNTIYLGSTNLWRSTDGFTSTKNTSWIGGYAINTSFPNYEMYPNQHPDQHNLIFYPSDPKKMIAACDGGVFRTDDNLASNVAWSSLNNGYLTSQFYTVAIDHATPLNDEILGGLQDNGTYFTRSGNLTTDWSMPGDGDGSFCAIADGRTDYYTSKQNGKTYHVKLDANGKTVKWGRVDPFGAKVSQFINPFTLDPNNQKRMYLVANHKIWKNDDVTQIPLHDKLDTVPVTTGWEMLQTQIDTTQEIASIAISRKTANRLYYGTVNGKLYRIDNASANSTMAKDITSTLFPRNAYLHNITIDPENADKVIAVFSNYNVQSIFYSTNGGTSWVAVSGNLEQFSNGTGNGPSCRWAAILPVKDKRAYFIATSTGLYSTDSLQGAKTIWTLQSPEGIGNTVCTMIDSRPSDGLVVVATHGNGAYSANINYTYQVTGLQEKQANKLSAKAVNIYPNPMRGQAKVSLQLEKPQNVTIDVIDEQGRLLANICNRNLEAGNNILELRNQHWRNGMYYLRISGTNNIVTKAFLIQ